MPRPAAAAAPAPAPALVEARGAAPGAPNHAGRKPTKSAAAAAAPPTSAATSTALVPASALQRLPLARAQGPVYAHGGEHRGFAVTNTLPVKARVELRATPRSQAAQVVWALSGWSVGEPVELAVNQSKPLFVRADVAKEGEVRGKFEFWVVPATPDAGQGYTVMAYFVLAQGAAAVAPAPAPAPAPALGSAGDAFADEPHEAENVRPGTTTTSSSSAAALPAPGKAPIRAAARAPNAQASSSLVLAQHAAPRVAAPSALAAAADESSSDAFERTLVDLLNQMLNRDAAAAAASTSTAPSTTPATTAGPAESTHVTLVRLHAEALRRRKALKIWQAAAAQLKDVFGAVQQGGLSIRRDVDVHRDVGVRERLVDLLLSYDPGWLAVAVGMVTGSDFAALAASQAALRSHLLTHVLSDPDIVSTHSHSRHGAFASTNPDFSAAISRHVLRQLLSIVVFLDKARTEEPNLLGAASTCLFCPGAKHKSSEAVLVDMASALLAGEGNVVGHLRNLHVELAHVQSPLDEYRFEVRSMAQDLRDGVVLARVAQLYAGVDVLPTLKVPASTRVHKLTNVAKLLAALTAKGDIDLDAGRRGRITNRDIVDGNRDKTLALVWRITLKFNLEAIVHRDALVREIKRLDLVAAAALHPGAVDSVATDAQDLAAAPHEALLLRWCSAVQAAHAAKLLAKGRRAERADVRDFSASLADGRALCVVVHYYHPELLPASAIGGAADARANFATLRAAVDALGSVPLRLDAPSRAQPALDAKLAFAFVAYLNARLLGSFAETRAAKLIQTAWAHFRALRRPADKALARRAARLAADRARTRAEEAKVARLLLRAHGRAHDAATAAASNLARGRRGSGSWEPAPFADAEEEGEGLVGDADEEAEAAAAAEEEARAAEQSRAEAARAEAERAAARAEARREAERQRREEEARVRAERLVREEAAAAAEALVAEERRLREEAEAKVRAEARARAQAEERAEAEARARAKAERDLRERAHARAEAESRSRAHKDAEAAARMQRIAQELQAKEREASEAQSREAKLLRKLDVVERSSRAQQLLQAQAVQAVAKLEQEKQHAEHEVRAELDSVRSELAAARAEAERARSEAAAVRRESRFVAEEVAREAATRRRLEEEAALALQAQRERDEELRREAEAAREAQLRLERELEAERRAREEAVKKLQDAAQAEQAARAKAEEARRAQVQARARLAEAAKETAALNRAVEAACARADDVAGAQTFCSAVLSDAGVCAALARSSDAMLRVVAAARRCSRGAAGSRALIYLLRALARVTVAHPWVVASASPVASEVAALAVDVMQTFYDRDVEFELAAGLVPTGAVGGFALLRLAPLRALLEARREMARLVPLGAAGSADGLGAAGAGDADAGERNLDRLARLMAAIRTAPPAVSPAVPADVALALAARLRAPASPSSPVDAASTLDAMVAMGRGGVDRFDAPQAAV